MKALNQFPVTEIVTTADGRIILNGPKGSMDITRCNDDTSSAQWHRNRYGPVSAEHGDHAVTVQAVTWGRDKPTISSCGTQFNALHFLGGAR